MKGPIVRDKTIYLASYEDTRERRQSPSLTTGRITSTRTNNCEMQLALKYSLLVTHEWRG